MKFPAFLTFLISSPSFWENLGSSFTEEKKVAAVNTVFTTPRVAKWLFSPLSLLLTDLSHSSEEFPVPMVRITSPSIGKNSLGLSPIWSFIFWNWSAMSARVCLSVAISYARLASEVRSVTFCADASKLPVTTPGACIAALELERYTCSFICPSFRSSVVTSIPSEIIFPKEPFIFILSPSAKVPVLSLYAAFRSFTLFSFRKALVFSLMLLDTFCMLVLFHLIFLFNPKAST